MTDHRFAPVHRDHRWLARPLALIASALLLALSLVSADVITAAEPAGAIAIHAGSPPTGPPPATAALLAAVTAAQRQIVSLGAYTQAQAYLKVAEAGTRAAGAAFDRSQARWRVAKTQVAMAVAAEAAARAKVELYQQALYELGIAEYTGATVQSNLDLASQERQVEQSELGSIAATDTSTGLGAAQSALATSIHHVQVTRVALGVATRVITREKDLLHKAKAQEASSRRALALARQWVLVPGLAPARPLVALARLEGELALALRAKPGP